MYDYFEYKVFHYSLASWKTWIIATISYSGQNECHFSQHESECILYIELFDARPCAATQWLQCLGITIPSWLEWSTKWPETTSLYSIQVPIQFSMNQCCAACVYVCMWMCVSFFFPPSSELHRMATQHNVISVTLMWQLINVLEWAILSPMPVLSVLEQRDNDSVAC